MLLTLCKDKRTTIGLIKVVSLVTSRNIMPKQHDNLHNVNEIYSMQLPMETLYYTLFLSLKNHIVMKIYFNIVYLLIP